MQPRKKQTTQERVPHKEKVLSEAQCTFLEEHSTPCHARAAGVKNPLTMRMIETTPAVEQLLADTILEQVDSVQKKLCALDCHVSRKEIHNYRQPRLEKLKKVAANSLEQLRTSSTAAEVRYAAAPTGENAFAMSTM